MSMVPAVISEAESFRLLVEGLQEYAVFLLDPRGRVASWNIGAQRIKGYRAEEIIGKPISVFYTHEECRAGKPEQNLRTAAETGSFSAEGWRLRKDGSRFFAYVVVTALRDESSRLLGYSKVTQDITQRKESEQRLAHAALLLANVQDAVIVTNLEGVVTYWNDAATRLFGWTADEMKGRPNADRFPEPVRSWIAKRTSSLSDGVDWEGEYEDYRKDGSRVWIDARVRRMLDESGKPVGVIGISHDITERKQIEAALRKSESRKAAILDAALDAIITMDHEGNIVEMNSAAEGMFGCRRDDTIGRNLGRMFVPPHLREQHERGLRRYMKTREPQVLGRRVEMLAMRSDGTEFPVEMAITRIAGVEPPLFTGYVRDLTQQKDSEQQIRLLLESTDEGIFGIDTQGSCTFINRAAAAMLGYAPAQLVGQQMHDLIHHHREDGSTFPVSECPIVQTYESGAEQRVRDDYYWRHDGTGFAVEYSACPVRDGGRLKGAVVTFRDVTQPKQLEEQLRQSQKMEAVGRLAGGIAHDFNNLLTIINGVSELLLDEPYGYDEAKPLIQDIYKAGERAAKLTSQLLSFSRKQLLKPRLLDLNAVMREMAQMLPRLIGEDVEIRMCLAPDLHQIKADPGQIEQIVMNLAVNARDAMPTGGVLTIETANADLTADAGDQRIGVQPGTFVRLVITDTGCGMDHRTQEHLFEPFFTTKEAGKGTGLGLATVYGIVKQSGGYIFVRSELGKGTRIEVLLRAVRATADPEKEDVHESKLFGGSETVLLVEDESGVRGLVRHLLTMSGYTVLEAANGADAMEIADQHNGPINLLLTDVVMPGMSGRELARHLCELRPGINVLYMSGYTDDAVMRHGISEEKRAFIQKPFSMVALARSVREVLGN